MADSERVSRDRDQSFSWCSIITSQLVKYSVPTYFIDRDFLQAVYESDPPDCRMSDINWPMPAMLFVMPLDFMQELTGGYDFPFIAVCQATEGVYQIKHEKLKSIHCPTQVLNDVDRFIFHFPGYFDQGIPVDYVASYENKRHIHEFAQFDDFIDWVADSKYKDYLPDGQPTREQEITINKKINSLTAKLLLAMTACPGAITNGVRLWPKNPPKPGQVLKKPEMHAPNFVGRKFRSYVKSEMVSEPTGLKVAPHWRRGHFQWTTIGPKADVYPVGLMPRTALGKIDWAACTPEQEKKFKETHKIDWIARVKINEELEND